MTFFVLYKLLKDLVYLAKDHKDNIRVMLSASMKDKTKTSDLFCEFKNGRNKNTQMVITADKLNNLAQIMNNFFDQNYKKFDSPIVHYRITFHYLHRINTFDILEATPSKSDDFMEYFLNAGHSLVNEKRSTPENSLSSQVIVNDYHEKNYKVYLLCLLSEKISRYFNNYYVLSNYDRLIVLLNNKDFAPLEAKSPVSDMANALLSKEYSFSKKGSIAHSNTRHQ